MSPEEYPESVICSKVRLVTTPTNETIGTSTVKPRRLASVFTRQRFAYIGFGVSILMVGIGAGIAFGAGYGLIAGGLLLTAFSWLLGNE